MRDNGQFSLARARLIRILSAVGAETETALVHFAGGCNVASVPFTRDRALLVRALEALSPGSSTPLAAAIREARRLMSDGLATRTQSGRAIIESDGDEQCGGNPAGELAALNELLTRRSRLRLPLEDARTPPSPPTPPPCSPSSETRFKVVISGPSRSPDIRLQELRLTIRPQVGGTCSVVLSRDVRSISYMVANNDPSLPPFRWWVGASALSREASTAVVKDKDELEDAQSRARELLWSGTDMGRARGEIEDALRRASTL